MEREREREPEIQGREIKEGCGLRERGGKEPRTSIGSRVAMPAPLGFSLQLAK